MEYVIKIPEETYKATCNGSMLPPDVDNVVNAIKNAIPLPKDHGDLIDAKDTIETLQIMFCRNGDLKNVCEQCILDCPVIVEACTYSEGKE